MIMKKNIFRIFIIIFIIFMVFPLIVNASRINPNEYEPVKPSSTDTRELFTFGGSVAGVIQIIGTIVSVGTLMIIGIRYMFASVEEKAEYKERIFPYLIGAVLLFGASTFVNILYKYIID